MPSSSWCQTNSVQAWTSLVKLIAIVVLYGFTELVERIYNYTPTLKHSYSRWTCWCIHCLSLSYTGVYFGLVHTIHMSERVKDEKLLSWLVYTHSHKQETFLMPVYAHNDKRTPWYTNAQRRHTRTVSPACGGHWQINDTVNGHMIRQPPARTRKRTKIHLNEAKSTLLDSCTTVQTDVKPEVSKLWDGCGEVPYSPSLVQRCEELTNLFKIKCWKLHFGRLKMVPFSSCGTCSEHLL